MRDRQAFSATVTGLGSSGLAAFDAILEQAPFGIYVDDPSLGCVYANDALLEQFGVTWADFQGFGWARFIVPEDADRLQEAIRQYEENKDSIFVTYRVKAPDASLRWIHARVQAVLDVEGRHIGSVGVTRNVTDEREFKSKAARQQKLEAVGRLSARLAHDLNNLLTVIIGSAELLAPASDRDARDRHWQTLETAFDQATQLTGQLLSLSRGQVQQPGSTPLDREMIGLERLLRATLGEGVQLDVSLGAPDCHVPVDPAALGQVLINLAINGGDAMDGRGRLGITTTANEDHVTVVVEDAGQGMDAETLARAFDPFFTTKEIGRGTGLGLATVRDIVEVHGGEITLDSQVGRGTRATVTIPRVGASPYRPAAAEADLARESAALRVLILEDNESIRQSLGYALALAGHTVYTADTIREARVRWHEVKQLDVIVTDVMLPDGRGPDFVRAVRSTGANVGVVFTSGFAGEDTGHLGELTGASVFLPKPFRARQVLAAIQDVAATRAEGL